jgi:hypothetical protein
MSDRRALLSVALGFLQLRDQPPEVTLLRRWLDSWAGLGDVITGLTRQDLDVELRQGSEWLASASLPHWDDSLNPGRSCCGSNALAGGAAGGLERAGVGS